MVYTLNPDIDELITKEVEAAFERGEQSGEIKCLTKLRSQIDAIAEQFTVEVIEAARLASQRLRSVLEGNRPYRELVGDTTPVGALEFSVRTSNCLEREKIDTVGQLAQLDHEDLRAINGLGHTGILEITRKLFEFWTQKTYPVKTDSTDAKGGPDEVNVDLDAVAAAAARLSAGKTSAQAALGATAVKSANKSAGKSSTRKGGSYKHTEGVRTAAEVPIEEVLPARMAAGMQTVGVTNLEELRALVRRKDYWSLRIPYVGPTRKNTVVIARLERFTHVK